MSDTRAAAQDGALGQPVLGLAALAGYAMFILYRAVAPYVVVQVLASGPPTYDLELWLASAMLAVTFPLIVVFADFLGFWPLRRGPSRDAPAATDPAG